MRFPLRPIGILVLCCASATLSYGQASPASADQAPSTQTSDAPAVPQDPKSQAWGVLNGGLTNSSVEKRTKAVRELGLLSDDKEAEDAALAALKDDKPDVRAAAAQSLGDMSAKSAKPQLLEALHDTDVAVILSAAHSLVTMGDERGYNVFYAVLTGEQKSGASLKEQQKKMLSDPKKLAGLGFEAGLGFVPFGGMGLTAFKVLTKDDVSPVLAAAALTLAKDPDPKSAQALSDAALQQKKWLVRAAAFDAIAKRGDPTMKGTAVSGLQDEQPEVQYAAAAAVIRLSDIEEKPLEKPKPATRKAPAKTPAKKSK
jgi:HEAT repeat protein